jgi:hypothetical protein
MPFTFPDDMTLSEYPLFENARPLSVYGPGEELMPKGGGGSGGHSHDDD